LARNLEIYIVNHSKLLKIRRTLSVNLWSQSQKSKKTLLKLMKTKKMDIAKKKSTFLKLPTLLFKPPKGLLRILLTCRNMMKIWVKV